MKKLFVLLITSLILLTACEKEEIKTITYQEVYPEVINELLEVNVVLNSGAPDEDDKEFSIKNEDLTDFKNMIINFTYTTEWLTPPPGTYGFRIELVYQNDTISLTSKVEYNDETYYLVDIPSLESYLHNYYTNLN